MTGYSTTPGSFLKTKLEAQGISVGNLSARTGFPEGYLQKLLLGDEVLYPETAVQLERVLGVPAETWEALERTYRGHGP